MSVVHTTVYEFTRMECMFPYVSYHVFMYVCIHLHGLCTCICVSVHLCLYECLIFIYVDVYMLWQFVSECGLCEHVSM